MDVDDRTQLAAVWLIGGPGPEATWPRALRGRYAKDRGEWYCPKGTSKTAIRAAASSRGDGVSGVEVAARSAPTSLAVSTPTRGASASSSFSAPTTGGLGAHVESTTFDSGTHDTGTGDDEPVSARRAAVEKAVQGWTDQLIDRSARNNLLFFRDQRAGTLDLTAAPRDVVFDVLAGRGRTLDRFVPPGEGQREERLTEAARRARAIHKKAREWFEERGIDTLYIAIGLATWTNPRGTAVPAAPVLLAPASLTPKGAAHNAFTLEVTGDLEVNPTLLNTFAKEFDVACDPEELLARPGMDGSIDTQIELEAAYAWLSEKAARVPGFAITSKIVLGNFSYAKLPMVKDLETSVAALSAHQLVAALAGDPDAQQATRDRRVEVDLSLPDRTPPADEFLVLDADSSQSRAINKVLAGQDLVIKGPPGTGKSQTISNLVATLVARGKTVLFVAEKRAAIDAVLERLDRVGLGDLVLDLHGGASSKRRIAQSLADALMANASIAEPRLGQEHRRLDARRSELNDWTSALHVLRKPWGVSLYEASERLIGLGSVAATDVRLRGTRVRDLTSDVIGSTRECLREYVGLGGLRASSTSPWSGAQVTTAEEAERAQELVDSLALGALEPILDRLEQATASAGARLPAVVADWDGRLTLWEATARLGGVFEAGLFDEHLPELLECLKPLERGFWARIGAATSDGDYRSARKRVKVVFRDGKKLTKARLFEALAAAHEVRTEWGELGVDQVPASPEDLESMRAGLASLQTELAELSELLDDDVTAASRAGLVDRLRELRADVATLGTLPELHRLRTTLDAVGLTELVEEITTWDADILGALDTFDYCVTASIFDEIQLGDVKASGFDGARHSETVAEYQHADVRHIATTAERVRRLAAERAHRVGDEAPEQAARVRREAAKRTRHQPIRELFAAAPEVMTAIKPLLGDESAGREPDAA